MNLQPATLGGYNGTLMKPFITRDGRYCADTTSLTEMRPLLPPRS